jgi:predicted DNA binding protein
MMKEEACDCSPEFCKSQDTSYHKHVKNSCIHIDGTCHDIDKSKNTIIPPDEFLDFKEIDLSETKQRNQS